MGGNQAERRVACFSTAARESKAGSPVLTPKKCSASDPLKQHPATAWTGLCMWRKWKLTTSLNRSFTTLQDIGLCPCCVPRLLFASLVVSTTIPIAQAYRRTFGKGEVSRCYSKGPSIRFGAWGVEAKCDVQSKQEAFKISSV